MTNVAKAPGKLVLSGAYSVLEGAPAIVTAVDRYGIANAHAPTGFVTEEMRVALSPPYPLIDASSLREDGRKLGLGSSAALLVAALACRDDYQLNSEDERWRLFKTALGAHRQAQGGGSGIDVAASTFGGTLRYQLRQPLRLAPQDTSPLIEPISLPSNLIVEVWSSPDAASTSQFIAQVYAFRRRARAGFEALMASLAREAEAAVSRCQADDARGFVDALVRQSHQLSVLGDAAGLPIVTTTVRILNALAVLQGACFAPAGAGGGDVNLWLGSGPSNLAFQKRAAELGLERVELGLHAVGAHRADAESAL